jgi:hypothetical protein
MLTSAESRAGCESQKASRIIGSYACALPQDEPLPFGKGSFCALANFFCRMLMNGADMV